MKLYKKVLTIICLFATLLSGCAQERFKPNYTVDGTSQVQGILAENLFIDAKITDYVEGGTCSEYELQFFNYPHINASFPALGLEAKEKKNADSAPGNLFYSSDYFSNHLSQMIFAYPKINRPTFEFEHIEFLHEKDLSFMSYEEASSKAKRIFAKLGVMGTSNFKGYGFDKSSLKHMESTMIADGLIAPRKNEDMIRVKEQWTQKDEVYFFKADLALEDITIFDGGIGSLETGDRVPGSIIELCFSSKEIEFIRFFNIYTPIKALPSQQILSLSDALNRIAENYSNIILTSPMTITSGALEYVPCLTRNVENYKLTPCWIFLVEYKVLRGENTYQPLTMNIIINAITGKEML